MAGLWAMTGWLAAGAAVGAALVARWRARRAAARHGELAAILDGLASGLLVVDADGNLRRVNTAARRLLGWERAPAPGTPLAVAAGEGWSALVDLVAAVLLSGDAARRCELSGSRPDGTTLPLGITVTPLMSGDHPGGAVAVFQDLTEVHRLRERMREQDRLATIGELAAGLAHEIRNPLGSIRGSAELLADSPVTGEDRELLELILRESERVNRLMEDFLRFARHRPPARVPVSAAGMLDEVGAALAVRDDLPSGWHLETDVPDDLVLDVDPDQVRQVLENLLVNALQADPGGRVTVTAARDGAVARITVRDHGPGVPPERWAEIFRPFVTSKPAGTGLGLAIARRIARAHGGDLTCDDAPGGGAAFHLLLPAVPSDGDRGGRTRREAVAALPVGA